MNDTLADLLALLPLLLLALLLIVAVGVAAIVYVALYPPSKNLGWCLGRGQPACPEDLHTTGQERTLQLARNDHTKAWQLDGQQPQGPTVLFAHGHAGSRYQALALVAPLLPHTSRIVTVDLPGHGDCSAKRSTVGVREPDDLAALITQLHEESPTTPLIVFGTSMGGQSALAAVAQPAIRPLVAGLIVYGGYRRFAEPFAGHLRRRSLPPVLFVPLALRILRLILGPGIRYDRTDDARQLACPLLLLHGDADDLCPLPLAQALRDAAQHHARVPAHLEIFRGGGHTRLHQTHPHQYAQALARFLQQCQGQAHRPPSDI